MYPIVDKLRNDHQDFVQLIDVISAQVHCLKTGRTADPQWLIDGMDLTRRRLDIIHGPFENLFQDRLLRRSGRAHRLLEPLLHEDHRRFMENCDRFTDSLYGALQGRVISRETTAAYGETAIGNLHRQIAFEERAVFPYAHRLFTPDDWAALNEVSRDQHEQPLIVNALQSEYRHLLERLDNGLNCQ